MIHRLKQRVISYRIKKPNNAKTYRVESKNYFTSAKLLDTGAKIVMENVYSSQKFIERHYKEVHPKTKKSKVSNDLIIPTINIEGFNNSLVDEKLLKSVCIVPSNATKASILKRAEYLSGQTGFKLLPTLAKVKLNPDIDFVLQIGEVQFSLIYFDRINNTKDTVSTSFEKEYKKKVYDTTRSAVEYEKKRPIIKAIEHNILNPKVLDATGGFGIDAFSMAFCGLNVTVIEKNPLMYALLYDSLQIAKQNEHMKPIANRMTIVHADSMQYINDMEEKPDVIYLDPMFPSVTKKVKSKSKLPISTAKVLLGQENTHTEDLLRIARNSAKHHTVLKRPNKKTESQDVHSMYHSDAHRWEIYLRP